MIQTNRHSGTGFSKAPVIIGGLGGSGTRVVAEIVRAGGLDIGTNLNTSLDNMNFAFAIESIPESIDWPYNRLQDHLDLFLALQFGGPWTFGAIWTLLRISFRKVPVWKPPGGPLRYARYVYLRSQRLRLNIELPWGWKAPRTQLYLPALNTYFQNCKYIHVIRHGLDMAFSTNVNQLLLYGGSFGIKASADDPDLPQKQLEFWIRSNARVLSYCSEEMAGRFFVLNYDRLCAEPGQEIRKLLNFCGLETTQENINKIAEGISPVTTGRYREHDLHMFSAAQLRAVRDLGFEVE